MSWAYRSRGSCTLRGACTGHVCGTCLVQLERTYRHRHPPPVQSLKRPQSAAKIPSSKKGRYSKGSVGAITAAIGKSKYYTALRHILARGPIAMKAFNKMVQKRARKQILSYMKNYASSFPTFTGLSSVRDFSWRTLVDELEREIPTLAACLHGAIPESRARDRTTVLPRTGLMMTIPLYTVNPKRFKFFQAVCGIEIWRRGGGEKLFKCLNHLGICQSSSSTRRNVNIICAESDKESPEWRVAVEEVLSSVNFPAPVLGESAENPEWEDMEDDDREDMEDDDREDMEDDDSDDGDYRYSLQYSEKSESGDSVMSESVETFSDPEDTPDMSVQEHAGTNSAVPSTEYQDDEGSNNEKEEIKVEDESSEPTRGSVVCGKPSKALRVRQKGGKSRHQTASRLSAKRKHKPEHTYDLALEDDDNLETLFEELRQIKTEHEKKNEEIATSKAPQVLTIDHDYAVSISVSDGDRDCLLSEDEEEGDGSQKTTLGQQADSSYKGAKRKPPPDAKHTNNTLVEMPSIACSSREPRKLRLYHNESFDARDDASPTSAHDDPSPLRTPEGTHPLLTNLLEGSQVRAGDAEVRPYHSRSSKVKSHSIDDLRSPSPFVLRPDHSYTKRTTGKCTALAFKSHQVNADVSHQDIV